MTEALVITSSDTAVDANRLIIPNTKFQYNKTLDCMSLTHHTTGDLVL
jgi:hypothetical protein